MTLTESDKKMLTEWLGECWHEWEDNLPNNPTWCKKCSKGALWSDITRGDGFYLKRAFLTDTDMMDCMRQLVKKGKWPDFELYSTAQWLKQLKDKRSLMQWLMCPTDEQGEPHFCKLVVEFKPWDKGTTK